MSEHVPSLATLTEAQRAVAMERFCLLRPALEDGVSQTEVARLHHLPLRTVQRWMHHYRGQGLAGLAKEERKDRGLRRGMPPELVRLIEGLALQKPKRSAAAIHRQVAKIATEHGWSIPSYSRVYDIIHKIEPAFVTLAHEGTKAYGEEFDLLYRREASHSNAMWQADHTLLPIWLLDEHGKPAKPWLTAIVDDYSRGVAGYFLGFQKATAWQTALTLHQAIRRKDDPRWHIYGIPSTFYTDNGSDFISHHMEQVAADLKIALIFSLPGAPRGRGKIERFFGTVQQMLLPELPGYAPKGSHGVVPELSLPAFDALFRTWLLDDYHQRIQSEIGSAPQARWEAEGFLPRMPESLEQLDLLLLTVAKGRRVQQDGIHFQGRHYLDTTLAAYVGEDVTIRYDPRDMAEIRVFYKDAFLCRAICPELAGQKITLKEITQARNERRKGIRQGIDERLAVVEQFIAVHQPAPLPPPPDPVVPAPTPRLKRYLNE
jgi:putative transposase